MDTTRDAELVSKICAGQRDLFRELVETYQARAYAIAFCRLRDPGLAEEAVQEAFIQAFNMLRHLRDPARFGPWLCRIVRRTAASQVRLKALHHRRYRPTDVGYAEPAAPTENPESQLERREVANVLREALDQLPKDLAETLTLFYIQENSVSDTARLLGISEAAVKTRLFRGRELLRKPLERILSEELRNLKPSPRLVPTVMAVLPALPGKGIGAAAPLATLFSLIQVAWFGFLMALNAHLFRRSLRNPSDYRPAVMQRNVLKHFPYMALTIVLSFMLPIVLIRYIGQNGITMTLGVLTCLAAAVHAPGALRAWRVANYRLAWTVLILSLVGLSQFIIGVLSLPRQFTHLPFVGFVILGLLALRVKVLRLDHNLFLRAMHSDLPECRDEPVIPLTPPITRKDDFLYLLGQEMLIVGAHVRPDGGRVLALPPVRGNFLRPQSWPSFSKITIERSGKVSAHLSPRDQEILSELNSRPLTEADVQSLEHTVARVITRSATHFSRGQTEQALSDLSRTSEPDLFTRGSVYKTPFAWLAIGGWLLFLIGLLINLAESICRHHW